MNITIDNSWKKALQDYISTDSLKRLGDTIRSLYLQKTIYPHPKNIFNAFNTTPFDQVSVVILGQDPYHGPHQAHGLSFSVPDGITPPPSLKNIYKEIEGDLGIKKDFSNGNLTSWAQQGVLLLNSILSVEESKPRSHAGMGWEDFTDYCIQNISQKKEHCVFLLWGNYARSKKHLIDTSKHLVLESPHPSPFSAHRGFLGNKHFSKTNIYLEKHNKRPINW